MNDELINYDKYIVSLESDNLLTVAKAVAEISSFQQVAPKGRVRELLLYHLNNDDLMIREFAIRATGMHWKMSEAYPIIFSFAKDFSLEEEIVEKSLASLNCYALHDETKKREVSKLMVNYMSSNKWLVDSKIYIYDMFLNLNKKTTIQEFATNFSQKRTKIIDFDLINKIMCRK